MKVDVETSAAVKKIADMKVNVEQLTAARNALVAGGKKFTDLTTEEQQQYVQLDQRIKAYNREISDTTRKLQNQIVAGNEYKGTLKGMCAELSAAKDELRAMQLTDPKYEEQRKKVEALNDAVKEMEQNYGVFTRNVGNYAGAVEPLTKQLKDLTDQLIAMKMAGQDNTAEYAEMSQKASQLKDAVSDVNEQIRFGASDTNALSTAMSAVSVASTGLMLLGQTFDKDSEQGKKLASVAKSLATVMMVLNALTAIQNKLQKQGLLQQAAAKVQLAASIALKKLEVKITQQQTGATIAQTIAQKALNAAMKANPILLIISALITLISLITAAVAAISAFVSGSKEQQAAFDREYDALERNKKAYEEYAAVLDNSAAGDREKAFKRFSNLIPVLNEAVNLYNKAISDAGNYLSDEEEERINKAEEAMKDLREEYNKQLSAMKVDILSMLDAYQTEQAEKGLTEVQKQLNGVQRELKYTIDIINDLQKRGEITGDQFTQAIAAAKANAAAETQAIKDAEAERQKEERRRRAQEYQRRQKEKADAAYNAALKAMDAEAKVEAEARKQRHASEAEEFAAKQDLEKKKLDLQKQYNKITQEEYDAALRVMAAEAETFAIQQAEKQAAAVKAAFDEAIKLAGGKNLAGRLADIEQQYKEAEEAIKNNTELTAEEKTYYLEQLEKRRTKAVQEARDEEGREEREAAEAAKKAAEDAAKAREEELARQVTIAGNDARRVYELRKAYIEKELEMEGLAADKKAKLEQELAELRSQYAMERINAAQEYVSQVTEIMSSLNTTLMNIESGRTATIKAEHDKRKENLDKQLAAGLISQKKYDKQVAKMDEELAEKEKEIAIDQAKREKALSIFQIAVNTAAAIMKIWAEVPKADFGVSTGVLTALAAAVGAAQIAAVASQPLPTAGKGGLIEGASHAQGGVLVNTEGGERIVAADPSRAFPELLNLISYIGKHADIPDTGYSARAAGLVAGGGGQPVDVDTLASRIGEQVGEQIKGLNIVMRWVDFENEKDLRARIEDSARQ